MVDDQAQPALEANTCELNQDSGIAYFDSAAGTDSGNTCRGNTAEGILVTDHARPTLEANTCEQNQMVGIAYFANGGGTARRNICQANEFWGIGVAQQGAPRLEGNTCVENRLGPLDVDSTARPILEKAQRKARRWWQG